MSMSAVVITKKIKIKKRREGNNGRKKGGWDAFPLTYVVRA
jgi:hypothetical protein